MSKSYRRPYSTWVGHRSEKQDRQMAARGVRRSQNQALKESAIRDKWDEFIIPHKYECSHNNRYSWTNDGKKHLITLRHNDFNPYHLMSPFETFWTEEKKLEWQQERLAHKLKWIADLKRK